MPIDLVARVDLDRLYLPLVEKVLEMLAACRARGADYFAVSGYRTYSEQMALWCQGRTQAGPIVTAAKAGESPHNFGLAVDFCRDGVIDRRGLQPDYRPESYQVLGEEARRVGLVWGGDWHKPDRPHVQWPGYVTKDELAPLKAIYDAGGGLTAVFARLDGKQVAA